MQSQGYLQRSAMSTSFYADHPLTTRPTQALAVAEPQLTVCLPLKPFLFVGCRPRWPALSPVWPVPNLVLAPPSSRIHSRHLVLPTVALLVSHFRHLASLHSCITVSALRLIAFCILAYGSRRHVHRLPIIEQRPGYRGEGNGVTSYTSTPTDIESRPNLPIEGHARGALDMPGEQ